MDVEKARELIQKSYEAMKGSNCQEEEWLKEALSLLDEPVCKTCRDTREVITGEPFGHHIPCPICQQPPAGEFAQILGTKIYAVKIKPTPDRINNLCDKATEACDRLDRIEAAYDIRYNDLRLANKSCNDLLAKCKKLHETVDGYEGAILEPLQEKYKQLSIENEELESDKAHLEEIESDLNNTIGFLQTGVDIWKEKAGNLEAEKKELEKKCKLLVLDSKEAYEAAIESLESRLAKSEADKKRIAVDLAFIEATTSQEASDMWAVVEKERAKSAKGGEAIKVMYKAMQHDPTASRSANACVEEMREATEKVIRPILGDEDFKELAK